MRKTIFEVGVAIAAAAAVYAVVSITDTLSPTLRLLLALGVAVVAFGIAWLAARRMSESADGIDIASRNTSKGALDIEDVTVDAESPSIGIGNDNKSTGDMRISGIEVGRRKRGK